MSVLISIAPPYTTGIRKEWKRFMDCNNHVGRRLGLAMFYSVAVVLGILWEFVLSSILGLGNRTARELIRANGSSEATTTREVPGNIEGTA